MRSRSAAAFPLTVLSFLLAGLLLTPARTCHAEQSVRAPSQPETTLLVVGVGCGILDVDLPQPEKTAEDFGVRFRVRFDLGYQPRPWLELGADLGLAMLGEADSLNAVLRQEGLGEEAAYTFVDFGLGARLFWRGESRWSPFVRAAGGAAWLSLAAPQNRGSLEVDPAWVAGVGVDLQAHRHVVLRLEGRYLGQRSASATRAHTSLDLVVLYALTRADLD